LYRFVTGQIAPLDLFVDTIGDFHGKGKRSVTDQRSEYLTDSIVRETPMHQHPKRAVIITFLYFAFVLPALQAQTSTLHRDTSQQVEPKAVLVELFTSEGCSSCPPADALLRQIDGKQTAAGQLIIGVSEHVTYWNSLGWSDPFSNSAYTDRQDAYGQRFHLDSVYTPQMVINGEEQIVGSDSSALLQAIREEQKQQPAVSVHINSVTAHGNQLTIDYSISGDAPEKGADVFAIVADDADKSTVLRGENSGRTLAHVSVARSITRITSLHSSKQEVAQISLPDVSKLSIGAGRHLVLFAQTSGYGRVLGVDSKAF
jgi:hypothetical protein